MLSGMSMENHSMVGGKFVCIIMLFNYFQHVFKVGFVLSMRMPTLGMIKEEETEIDRAEVTEIEIPEEGKDEHTWPW
jgi:hypothetical protein